MINCFAFYVSPNIWKDSPKGLSQPAEKSKVVVFHAILPTALWEWDSESEVYIRFGHPNLGEWRCDCGPMTLERYCYYYSASIIIILFFTFAIGMWEMEYLSCLQNSELLH